MQKRGINIDSLALIFSFIIVAQLMSYVIMQGTFERTPFPDNPNRMMVVAGSYTPVGTEESVTLPPWHFLVGITKGLADAQDIIFLIFIVGGVIEILRRTGAIDAALHGAVEKLGHSPWILILGCFVMFSLGSFTIGMGEEYVPLIPIIVTMSLAMRMDGVVAMGMVWIPYGIGWGCAGINPFGVLIAQNIAGAETFVAEVDGAVVGFASILPQRDKALRPEGPGPTPDGEVAALYVLGAHHRRGIGTALWRASLDGLRRQGWQRASLEVHRDNAGAIAFYKAQGARVLRDGEGPHVLYGVAL